MRLLHEMVVPRIAADWSIVAVEYKQLQVIKQNVTMIQRCCVELLRDWLSSDIGIGRGKRGG